MYALDDMSYVYGQTFALIGYVVVLLGFHLSANFVSYIYSLNRSNYIEYDNRKYLKLGNEQLNILGILFAIIGGISLIVYILNIGGFIVFIKYSGALRSDTSFVDTKFTFLKSITPLLLTSSFFFFACVQNLKEVKRILLSKILFWLSFLCSFIVLFHMAGRLRFFSYLFVFPMVIMVKNGKYNFRVISTAIGLALLLILFGKQMSHLMIDPNAVERKINLISSSYGLTLTHIIGEFAFPMITLAKTVFYAIPDVIPYRYFIDFFLAILYLIPKRIFSVSLPETATDLNVAYLGAPIPVDLISFGFFNGGIVGLILTCFLFGVSLSFFEKAFPSDGDPIVIIFRVAWIFFMGFRVMYADPVNSLKVGIYLVFGTLAMFFVSVISKCLIYKKTIN
jgi:hypothetical protein